MEKYYGTKRIKALKKRGQTQFWEGACFRCDDGKVGYKSYSWQEGGKVKESELFQVSEKNVGRSNQTTLEDQAISEIESKLLKKIDEGYEYEDGTPVGKRYLLPMLAKSFDKEAYATASAGGKVVKKKNPFTFPCDLQFKYDGIRCLHDGTEFWSRKGKPFVTANHLRIDTNGIVVDGELMLPRQEFAFELTVSAVKQLSELSKNLIYILYDCYDPTNPNLTYRERLKVLQSLPLPAGVSIAPTEEAWNIDDVKAFQTRSVAEGYEGTMLRSKTGVYLPGGFRSDDLLKYKDFIDEEFNIVGFTDGDGKEEGAIIFTCEMSDGKQFTSRPKGTYAVRREWFKKGNEFIGKSLTVRYQELSDEGIPRFNVGVAVRDYE
jgi:ATP-dependent DNA ligase